MEKIIHIHAKCAAFEIFEQVPEKKSVKRLIKIRSMFQGACKHFKTATDKLVVKTIVVNPEFNFK